MTRRLFVDVDDTLVKWERNAKGRAVKSFPNEAVVRFVRAWRVQYPDAEIYVWSIRGAKAAVTTAGSALKDEDWDYSAFRGFLQPRPGDLFIDDDPFESYAHATIHPSVLEAVCGIPEPAGVW